MQVRSPVVATTAVPTASYERQAPFYASAARASHLLGKAGAPRTSDRRSAVRAKKAKTPARSIRYLLSVDRRLKKISLRRISERLKRVKRQRRSRSTEECCPREFSACKKFHALTVGDSGRRGDMCGDRGSVDRGAGARSPNRCRARRRAARSQRAAGRKSPRRRAWRHRRREWPNRWRLPLVKSTAKSPAVEPVSSGAGTITMTGCLELDDETFWLKDASGADVPASRSWRSGFLKKRAARIELVDAAHTLKLQGHVGERVAATGILTNREMLARSLRRVAATCN